MKIRTILFDLDGTLLDTAPDLAFALNAVLQEQQRPPLPFSKIRPHISHGGEALVRLGFNLAEGDPASKPLHTRLVEIYSAHIADHTKPFDGMLETLNTLDKKGINWGIVTNKPANLTMPLLEKFKFACHSACNICGDTLEEKKPHPAPLLYACELMQILPENCVYVGDAQRDIEAGQRAGMRTLIASYGYFRQEDHPETWGATGSIQQPLALLDWIDR